MVNTSNRGYRRKTDAEQIRHLFMRLDQQIDGYDHRRMITPQLNTTEIYGLNSPSKREIKKTLGKNLKLMRNFLMAKKLEGCSFETISGYKCTLQALFILTGKDALKLSSADIREYLSNYQRQRGVSNITIDTMRRTFSSFYSYLEDEDLVTKSPMRKIHHIKCEKTIQKPFTEEEIERLRDCAVKHFNIRDLSIIEFLNSSGVRVSELIDLDIDDIDFGARECIVFGKGQKERIVYFDSKTRIHLQQYLKNRTDDNPALFVNFKSPYPRLSIAGVEFIVKEIGKMANVEHCHPHRFRRTLATRLLDRGVPIEQVQRILGHTKIDTTLIYAQVNQESVKLNHSKFCS